MGQVQINLVSVPHFFLVKVPSPPVQFTVSNANWRVVAFAPLPVVRISSLSDVQQEEPWFLLDRVGFRPVWWPHNLPDLVLRHSRFQLCHARIVCVSLPVGSESTSSASVRNRQDNQNRKEIRIS